MMKYGWIHLKALTRGNGLRWNQTPVKTFEREKNEKNFTGKEWLIVISKSLLYLKVKGDEGKFWAAI